jgi:hypothetical protein
MNRDLMLSSNTIAPVKKKENLKKQKKTHWIGDNSRPSKPLPNYGIECNMISSETIFNHSTNGESSYHQKKSKPIHFIRKRTDSEIQFYADTLAAEYRDYCMFHRIHGRQLHDMDRQESPVVQYQQGFSYDNMYTSVDSKWIDESSGPESHELTHHHIMYEFAFQKEGTQTFSSCPLPSLISLLDFEPQGISVSYDEDEGIFDLEL